jgi:hypothetical protein
VFGFMNGIGLELGIIAQDTFRIVMIFKKL